MCGISGFHSLDSAIQIDTYYRAYSILKHRGPDDEGFAVMVDNAICHASGDDTIDHFKDLTGIHSFESSRIVIKLDVKHKNIFGKNAFGKICKVLDSLKEAGVNG